MATLMRCGGSGSRFKTIVNVSKLIVHSLYSIPSIKLTFFARFTIQQVSFSTSKVVQITKKSSWPNSRLEVKFLYISFIKSYLNLKTGVVFNIENLFILILVGLFTSFSLLQCEVWDIWYPGGWASQTRAQGVLPMADLPTTIRARRTGRRTGYRRRDAPDRRALQDP